MAFLISEPEGCSTTSMRIPFGSITFDRREPVAPPERTSGDSCARLTKLRHACALASSVKMPMCVRPAGRFALPAPSR